AALAARAPDPAGALETWTGDGRWTPGFHPERAAVVMEDNASEMSVRHHREAGLWVALYSYPDVAGEFPDAPPSDAVYARTAPAPGPFARPGGVTSSYVCNLFGGPDADPFPVLQRLQREMDIYRPVPATVALPEPPGARDPADGRD